jgi:hypothetical protein
MIHQIYADFYEENIFSDFFNHACFRIISMLFCPVLIHLKLQLCTLNVFTIILVFMECTVRYYKRIFLASLFHNDSILYIEKANHYGHTKEIRIEQPLCDSQPILLSLKGQGNEMFLFLFFMNPSMHALSRYNI